MRITRPRATQLSQITIDVDLDMGAHNITLDALQTVDGEDVSAHVAAAYPHSGHAVIKSGSYAGDSTVNRAIAHGLGRAPQMVFFFVNEAGFTTVWGINVFGTVILAVRESETPAYVSFLTVTDWDETNFYVGNASSYDSSMNGPAWTPIYWVAIG